MTGFNVYWGGLDYVEEDSVPPDGFAITFVPSLVNDSTAGALQLEAEASTQQYMQNQFRASTENILGAGVFASAIV